MVKTEFDIIKLASEFKNLIDWMLKYEYGKKIKSEINLFKNFQNELDHNPDSIEALKTLLQIIVTQAWYYRTPKNFNDKIDQFFSKYHKDFRKTKARKHLIGLVEELAPKRIKNQAEQRIRNLLSNYTTIKQFTEELYISAKKGKNNDVLGEKGRDNYLRDFGYWDRIPMDRHEMRFIFRTGIYHACSIKSKCDPLQKSSFHNALTRFCALYLKGKVIEDINLAKEPGIVDIFIWSYCGKERYNICGSNPKCEICNLKRTCLYFLTNVS